MIKVKEIRLVMTSKQYNQLLKLKKSGKYKSWKSLVFDKLGIQ